MNPIAEAARRLATGWQNQEHIEALPEGCRPVTRAEGYAVQALWPALTWLGNDTSGSVPPWPGQSLQAAFTPMAPA